MNKENGIKDAPKGCAGELFDVFTFKPAWEAASEGRAFPFKGPMDFITENRKARIVANSAIGLVVLYACSICSNAQWFLN